MVFRVAYEQKSVVQTVQRKEETIAFFDWPTDNPPRDEVVELVRKLSAGDFVESSIRISKIDSHTEGLRILKLK